MEAYDMTVFDLLFIAVFFTALGMLFLAILAALRGRRARALALLRRLAIFAGVYLGIIILVSLLSPRRVLQVGDDQCWDDWCMTVTNVQRRPADSVTRYVVTIRISSRARRADQRALDAHVYLIDDRGRRYDPVPDPADIPFDILLHPQEAISMTRVFELAADVQDPVLVASHGEGFPGWFIIGDSASLFHKRTVVRLE
jgi:hypothetical protein